MKYQTDIVKIPSCPPDAAEPKSSKAFRIVHNPLCEKSFLPPGKISPKRMQSECNNSERKCSMLALSLFSTKDKAIKRFKYLESSFQNIRKRMGDCIAEGTIYPQDGLQTTPSKSGHFDLYESSQAKLEDKFKIIEQI